MSGPNRTVNADLIPFARHFTEALQPAAGPLSPESQPVITLPMADTTQLVMPEIIAATTCGGGWPVKRFTSSYE